MTEIITNWDLSVLLFIQDHIHNDFLTPVMIFITSLGYRGAVWIALILILLLFKKTRRAACAAAVTMLITAILVNLILKPHIARLRPYDFCTALVPLVEELPDYSFPSGHTSSGFSVSLTLFWMLPKKYFVWPVVLSALIAFSRLYVLVHYPTDVICGFLIALAVSLIVSRLFTHRGNPPVSDG